MTNEHHDYIESDAGEYGEAPVNAIVELNRLVGCDIVQPGRDESLMTTC